MVSDPQQGVHSPQSRRSLLLLIGAPIAAAVAITAAVVSMNSGEDDPGYVSPLRTTAPTTTHTAAPTYSTPVPTYTPRPTYRAPEPPWTTLRADQLPKEINDALWERLYEKVFDGMDDTRAHAAKDRCDAAEKYRRPFLLCLINTGYWMVYDPTTRTVWK